MEKGLSETCTAGRKIQESQLCHQDSGKGEGTSSKEALWKGSCTLFSNSGTTFRFITGLLLTSSLTISAS